MWDIYTPAVGVLCEPKWKGMFLVSIERKKSGNTGLILSYE
jgi:hypothetical protein